MFIPFHPDFVKNWRDVRKGGTMGLAACILEQDPTENFRDMIHDEVDKWVDRIIDEVFEDGKEPTITWRYWRWKTYEG